MLLVVGLMLILFVGLLDFRFWWLMVVGRCLVFVFGGLCLVGFACRLLLIGCWWVCLFIVAALVAALASWLLTAGALLVLIVGVAGILFDFDFLVRCVDMLVAMGSALVLVV